jgi:hypothetical protein
MTKPCNYKGDLPPHQLTRSKKMTRQECVKGNDAAR